MRRGEELLKAVVRADEAAARDQVGAARRALEAAEGAAADVAAARLGSRRAAARYKFIQIYCAFTKSK